MNNYKAECKESCTRAFKKIDDVQRQTYIRQADDALMQLMKLAGIHPFKSAAEMVKNHSLYTSVVVLMDAAKERLMRFTELTDEMVFCEDKQNNELVPVD